jgi:hypothetical protein
MSLEWTRQPLRFLQHLLRETDAEDLTAKQLIDEMISVGANACIAMGGGFSAWYPTKLSCQTVNPHLNGDFLGDFLAAAKAKSIRVLIRMDISKGRAGAELENPDWFVRKANGDISTVWAMPQMCATGDFWQKEAFSILGEIMERYPSGDGFFFNYLHVPRCHCARCQTIVREATGATVPAAGTRDPIYEGWRADFLASYMGRVRAFIQERNPAAALVPYHHVHDGWDVRKMAAITDDLEPVGGRRGLARALAQAAPVSAFDPDDVGGLRQPSGLDADVAPDQQSHSGSCARWQHRACREWSAQSGRPALCACS